MRTIDKLALRDDYWQRTALTICKDKDLAKDLVQDMYIKLSESEFYSDWYVINTIRNLFVDTIRKNREDLTEDQVDIPTEEVFEPNDIERMYINRLNNLSNTQQEFIAESYDKSDRAIGKEFRINYGYVHKKRIEGIKSILGDRFNLYENTRLKHLKDNLLTDEEFSDWVERVIKK